MSTQQLPPLLLLHLLLLVHLSCFSLSALSASIALPGCPEKCGDIDVPYPFGIQDGCWLQGFQLECNQTVDPPKLSLPTGEFNRFTLDNVSIATTIEATEVTLDNLTIAYTSITQECYTGLPNQDKIKQSIIDLGGLPYTFSYERNRLTAVGCDTSVIVSSNGNDITGCVSMCSNVSTFQDGVCSGVGCCQSSLLRGVKSLITTVSTVFNHTRDVGNASNNCSYAFPADRERYSFAIADLKNFSRASVPVVLDWAIGNETCAVAKGSPDYACGGNADCVESTNGPGYRCRCKDGYHGNPYLQHGCQDIDECTPNNKCSHICTNTAGNYTCSCPEGTYGDGLKAGKGCIDKNKSFPLVQLVLGIGLGFLFTFGGAFLVYYARKKRNMMRLREKYFEQNGGSLLKQQLSTTRNGGSVSGRRTTARIFTENELKAATGNFSENKILGKGGNGIVYKGVLPEGTVVAIKRSRALDEDQKDQFVNEVVILSQVIHRNVVKIVGCCLETKIPLLVYEYVPNRTLFDHIHDEKGRVSMLSWETRLRIAAETASAIAYLHSSVDIQIVHRDIKSANILLDHNFTAKVSDFGASRVIPLDQLEVATMVQGTLGYLDPEYFLTGQLTDKSDVYSFGVVLVELISGKTPISGSRRQEESNLAMYFLLCIKEERLAEILDPRVRNEGDAQQVKAVAELAKRCLRLKAEERPSMREVAAELERVRGYGLHQAVAPGNVGLGQGGIFGGAVGGESYNGMSGGGDSSGINDARSVVWELELQR